MVLSKVVVVFLLAIGLCFPSDDKEVRLKLSKGAASARGFIGGESHDLYSIELLADQTVTITVTAKENQADFVVSEEKADNGATPVAFGTDSAKDHHSWVGQIPLSRRYYIYVTGYPSAHYRLQIRER